jgi:DNA polymerase (family X)
MCNVYRITPPALKNKDIVKHLKRYTTLLDLHGQDTFKIKGLQSAVFNLEKVNSPLAEMTDAQLQAIQGVGKSTAAAIRELLTTGALSALQQIEADTPPEVLEMAFVRGVGAKKTRSLWQELHIDSIQGAIAACGQGAVAKLKGLGEKTQDNIREALEYHLLHRSFVHYSKALALGEGLLHPLQEAFPEARISLVGDLRRKMEVVDTVSLLCATTERMKVKSFLNEFIGISALPKDSGPLHWVGAPEGYKYLKVSIKFCQPEVFGTQLLLQTGSLAHLNTTLPGGKTLAELAQNNPNVSEEEIYRLAGLAYVEPELREGEWELVWAQQGEMPRLLEETDLQGSLHNHSVYSDGWNTVEEMAQECITMGYSYLGISDHSKSAAYAGGLFENKVQQQHREIEELNAKLAPFRIFKGIESDILDDGSLDYAPEVLASFDFIVASIHSGMNMDIRKATHRLITAIANPFTTFLGHPTGRLLLERPGYPIDHRAVIDACAAHGVIIEINANPYRLDLDWRWVRYALDKGVMLSINPDAHDTGQLHLVKFGVAVARKAGLTPEMTFNCKPAEEVAAHFSQRKERALALQK